MRCLFSGLAFCGLLAAFSSCEEKDYTSRLPIFSGFVLSQDVLAPGDSITITAKQATKGTLLNGTIYQWTIKDVRDSVVLSEKQEVIYDHQPDDPVIGYRIPADARTGRYTVTFYAEYKYSGQSLEQRGPADNSGDQSVVGTIKPVIPVSAQVFRGACQGDIRFNVE